MLYQRFEEKLPKCGSKKRREAPSRHFTNFLSPLRTEPRTCLFCFVNPFKNSCFRFLPSNLSRRFNKTLLLFNLRSSIFKFFKLYFETSDFIDSMTSRTLHPRSLTSVLWEETADNRFSLFIFSAFFFFAANNTSFFEFSFCPDAGAGDVFLLFDKISLGFGLGERRKVLLLFSGVSTSNFSRSISQSSTPSLLLLLLWLIDSFSDFDAECFSSKGGAAISSSPFWASKSQSFVSFSPPANLVFLICSAKRDRYKRNSEFANAH